ncbi:MAG: DUF1080 domain-containing protein [Gemmataceae bacterium]|nr:DUF1080 domain-containing protein [Gemmataceae bacterium]
MLRIWMALFFMSVTVTWADDGVLPVGADGKPLNLDFETGDLRDWKATGNAFEGQPIKGDTVFPRRNDMKSKHQGQFWIGGYEKLGDKAKGTLTSAPFKVTHPFASFLVAGGPHPETCVQLVRKDNDKVFFQVSGLESEELQRVVVDLKEVQNTEIYIRLVDQHTGHWGHVNFDDFRFHKEKPNVPERPKAPVLDQFKYAGLKPLEAAKAMTVPAGFSVKLFAGEPDVHQPIAFCLDERGRLWVAECYTYPRRLPHNGPVLPENLKDKGDRIVIFEDSNGDGTFDKRTVFFEGLNLLTGIQVGYGGVWVGAAPYFLFIPIEPMTEKAGEVKILLDGWGYQDTHETLNTFTWGPDGWLYGCHGVFTHSRVGKPGTPDAQRIPINAGIWRYHPTKHIFEVYAHGTSNPWGLAFNEVGEAFVEACVIPHNWHIIPGGRYHRQAGQHFNPYTYADIQTIAEHRHYVGATPHGGNGRSDEAGGGHAHCGTMIYQGGTWPQEYHHKMFMGNIHGRRLNIDNLIPNGSGYKATRHPDFLLANDAWARFINLAYGPDGNVFLIDWYDKQACHNNTTEIWDRTNGRIYKIVHKDTKPVSGIDLQKCTDAELLAYQFHANEWYANQGRRILAERAALGKWDTKKVNELLERLKQLAQQSSHPQAELRCLWASFALSGGVLPPAIGESAAQSKNPAVVVWAYRLASQNLGNKSAWNPSTEDMLRTLQKNNVPAIRLGLASVLQRYPHKERVSVLKALFDYSADATDHNLPLMYWYAWEPVVADMPEEAMQIAAAGKIPLIRDFTARRVGALGTPESLALLVKYLGQAQADSDRQAYLNALTESLRGKRNVPMPQGWPETFTALQKSSSAAIRNSALALAVTFGDRNAFATLRTLASNPMISAEARNGAITPLAEARDPKLPELSRTSITDPQTRSASIRAFASVEDAEAPALILKQWSALSPAEKREALMTLTSRVKYAEALLNAISEKKLAANELPADLVRNIRNLNDKALQEKINAVWGTVRETPEERKKLIAEWRAKLSVPSKTEPDLMLGRALFAKNCQQCHTLYGVGGKVGPDITGSNRSNLDYLLENIFDPSAVIQKEYAATVFTTTNGRTITGIVKEDRGKIVTIATADGTLTLNADDIDTRRDSLTSMMPDDLTKQLSESEIRALFAYLRHPTQVPQLVTKETAKDFFNGKDLTGWIGDKTLWSVQDGEIVGSAPKGLKKNEFLKSELAAGDFKLTLKVKLTPNTENSGIQFRSEILPDGDVKGYQADIGKGWWGKLYEEHGRAILWDKSGEEHVKAGEWNEYVIEAVGSRIRTYINGKLCVDLDDPKGVKRGIFALQLHSGGPIEVRFKDLQLEVK